MVKKLSKYEIPKAANFFPELASGSRVDSSPASGAAESSGILADRPAFSAIVNQRAFYVGVRYVDVTRGKPYEGNREISTVRVQQLRASFLDASPRCEDYPLVVTCTLKDKAKALDPNNFDWDHVTQVSLFATFDCDFFIQF